MTLNEYKYSKQHSYFRMNYTDLEKIPGISLKKHHKKQGGQQSLDLHQLDLKEKGYSVVTLSLEQTFNDMLNINGKTRSGFKNLFTTESISTTMLQKTFEFFFRIMMTKNEEQGDHLRLLPNVHTNDQSFFERFIRSDEPVGFQLAKRMSKINENEVDYEFKQEVNRCMSESIFFTILNSSKQTYDYQKNILFLIEFFCILRLYHIVKMVIDDCERFYHGFHISFDTMLIVESHESFTNCYDLSLSTIIQLIEKRFRLLCQEDIEKIDSCYSTFNVSFQRGHVDSRIFKIDDDDRSNMRPECKTNINVNVNVKKKMMYLEKMNTAEKKIFKAFSKYVPKRVNSIILLLIEKKAFNGVITLRSLLDTIAIFVNEKNIQNILLDLQSHHLSSNLKSISSRYTNFHPRNTLHNCFTSFPTRAHTTFNSNRLHHLFREKFPLHKVFCTDFYEISTMRSLAQLYKHVRRQNPSEASSDSRLSLVLSETKKDELVLYSYIYQYMTELVGRKDDNHNSIMSMYLNVFESKFKHYFRLNIRQKLKQYNVRLELLDNVAKTHTNDDDDAMVLEHDNDNENDILQEEIRKLCVVMNDKQKTCASKSEYILVERIYVGFQLFIDFFSSLKDTTTTLDILQFYLQLLFGIQLDNNNYRFDDKKDDNYDLIWSIAPLFFLQIYSINLEDLTFLEKTVTRHFIAENYEQFIRLLKTIEFDVFDFRNRPEKYSLFEIEQVFLKRIQSLYYDENLVFLKQIIV